MILDRAAAQVDREETAGLGEMVSKEESPPRTTLTYPLGRSLRLDVEEDRALVDGEVKEAKGARVASGELAATAEMSSLLYAIHRPTLM